MTASRTRRRRRSRTRRRRRTRTRTRSRHQARSMKPRMRSTKITETVTHCSYDTGDDDRNGLSFFLHSVHFSVLLAW